MTPRRFIPVLCACVLLSGCQALGWDKEMQPRAAKTLRVSQVAYTHVIQVSERRNLLSQDEVRRLQSFIGRTGAHESSRVHVIARSQATSQRKVVIDALSGLGVSSGIIDFGIDDQALAADEIHVTVEKHAVTLPACPDFTSSISDNHTNQPHSNWGCATAMNLGLMVANPRDLVQGRGRVAGDGEALTLGVQRYRSGETRALNIGDGNTGDTYSGSSSSNSSSGGGQ